MNKKRPILVQGAMEIEVKHFKEIVSNLEEIEIHGYKFFKGMYKDYPIVISKTEIGILESGLATYIGITNFNPVAVINQGTAGGYSEELHRYDIVIGEKCINTNSYRTRSRDEKEGSNPFEWEMLTFKNGENELVEMKPDNKLKEIVLKCASKYEKGQVVLGTIGSGDVWNDEVDRLKWFNKMYNVQCEEMETASVYSVCNKLKVPVIGIRVISNTAVLKENFDPNTAIELQKYIMEVVKELIKSLKGE